MKMKSHISCHVKGHLLVKVELAGHELMVGRLKLEDLRVGGLVEGAQLVELRRFEWTGW